MNPLGPFAVILRRSGSGWECVAMYNGPFGGVAKRTSWARTRATALLDVRVVLR